MTGGQQQWNIKSSLLLWIFQLGYCLQYVSGNRICEKLSNTSDLHLCYEYEEAEFGLWTESNDNYIEGVVVTASPSNACTVVTPKYKQNISIIAELGVFLLIDEGACDYDVKGFQATIGEYDAAIIRNMHSDSVVTMQGNKYKSRVRIFTIYVGKSAGETLEKYDVFNNPDCRVRIEAPGILPDLWELEYYMIPFAIIVGICFILMAMFMISRYYRHYLEQRRNRLSPKNLRKIPTKKYKKGDDFYDICAICLEEYKDGERLRILPCEHAYHCKCVDPWLTEGKRTCPVCKQPVENDRRPRTRRQTAESTDEVDETTPLIASLPSPAPASRDVVA